MDFPMHRADRLFQTVETLRVRRTATAAMLADQFGVSLRTVYRDIRDLIAAGIPIRGEAGVGYRLDANEACPPIQLTPAEIKALILGVRMVQRWAGPGFAEESESLLNKLRTQNPDKIGSDPTAIPLFAAVGPWDDSVRGYFDTVLHAIESQQDLTLSYQARNRQNSSRVVRPLALFFWGNKWTLGAWCFLRAGYRNFRLDRMKTIHVESSHPPLPSTVCLEGYLIWERERLDRPANTYAADASR